MKVHYKPRPITRRYNQFVLDGEIAKVIISRRDGQVFHAIIDADELPEVRRYTWRVYFSSSGVPYVRTNTPEGHFGLHRLIMDAPPGTVVDHINRIPLDNRRVNLRIVSQYQNCHNRSDTRGFHLNRESGKWRASIGGGKNRRHIGYFLTREEAAAAAAAAHAVVLQTGLPPAPNNRA